MANELFESMGENIKRIDVDIKETEDMIQFLADVGEPVSEQKNNLAQLRAKRDKFATALKKRGVNV